MKTKSFLTGLGGVLVIGCIAACSDSTSPGGSSAFDAQVTADIAPAAAQDISTEALTEANVSNSSYSGSFSMASFSDDGPSTRSGVFSGWVNSSCVLRDNWFHCPRVRWGLAQLLGHGLGTTDTISYQVFKTDTTTDSVEFMFADTTMLAYTFNSRSYSDTAGHHRNATLILSHGDTVHVWNAIGSGTVATERTGPNDTTIYTLASNDTTIGLTFYVAHNGHHRYPISGQIIRNYTVTLDRQGRDTTHRTTTRRVVVTFDSTATPTMTINGNTSFTMNLQSPGSVQEH